MKRMSEVARLEPHRLPELPDRERPASSQDLEDSLADRIEVRDVAAAPTIRVSRAVERAGDDREDLRAEPRERLLQIATDGDGDTAGGSSSSHASPVTTDEWHRLEWRRVADPIEAEPALGGDATLRSLATAWDRDAPTLVAAACAAEGLGESSALAADHWLAGEYLVARYLDRLLAARAGRVRRKVIRPGGATRLDALGFVEQRFWNVRSVEARPLADAAEVTPAASEPRVVESDPSPWPAVLDALHHVFLRRHSVLLRFDESQRTLMEALAKTLGACDAIRFEVRPSDAAPPAGVRPGVTPVVVLPTLYDRDELSFMAEQAVAAASTGAHYGIGAVVALVLSRSWPQRDRFADLVARAAEAYGAASSRPLRLVDDATASDVMDWGPEERGLAAIALRADRPEPFLRDAVAVCNDELPDSLAAALIAHPLHLEDRSLSRNIEEGTRDLAYGMVGINVWPTSFRALSDAPFGRHPRRRGSGDGLGFTQNAADLASVEKVVAHAPLRPVLAPASVTSSARLTAARELCTYRGTPSLGRAASIAWKTLWA